VTDDFINDNSRRGEWTVKGGEVQKAGWFLIIVGTILIVVRSVLDWVMLLKPRPAQTPTGAVSALTVGLPDLGKVAELLKETHGPGVALVITGAVLLLAGSGIDVSFGGTSPSPTPSPT
jgi:hypothetical protein